MSPQPPGCSSPPVDTVSSGRRRVMARLPRRQHRAGSPHTASGSRSALREALRLETERRWPGQQSPGTLHTPTPSDDTMPALSYIHNCFSCWPPGGATDSRGGQVSGASGLPPEVGMLEGVPRGESWLHTHQPAGLLLSKWTRRSGSPSRLPCGDSCGS